jgi:hypothetical protein
MNTPPSLRVSYDPVLPHFGHALGGIWRLTFRRVFSPKQLLALAGLLTIFALLSLVNVHERNADNFLEWTINFYLTALVPVTAFLAGGGAIRDDMKGIAVDYILTRPVRRRVYVPTKFFCHLVCVQLLQLLPLGVLVGVGVFHHIPGLADALPRLVLAQGATVAAFLALGYLCGAMTARYLVLGIFYAGIVEVGFGQIPIQLNKLSVLHHVRTIVADLFTAATDGAEGWLMSLAMIVLFVVIWVAAATAFFAVQEFAGQRPKDA